MKKINDLNFFKQDAETLAKNLIGKWIETNIDGKKVKAQIKETEAYLGTIDSACHSYKGKRTKRTETMYMNAGTIYIYLCYGMHYLLNFVCAEKDVPEAVLIRALVEADGPAKATKFLNINNKLNGETIINNSKLSIWDDEKNYSYVKAKRVGIDYALNKDKNAMLRFILKI